ncbi:MAG: ATP-grasp domain-containing protein [Planctomycetota bacterium]
MVRLFVYEWITGGGLVGHEGPLPESLLREGLAMVQAVAADAASTPNVTPVLLRDLRLPSLSAAGGEIVEVASRSEHDAAVEQLATEAEAVLLIGPETDGALLGLVKGVESLQAKLISPGSAFVEVAADKGATGTALAAAGVPVPPAVRLASDEPLPTEFAYPAVIKPMDGAGSQDTHVVAHQHDRPPAYAWPRRLESYVPGVPVSVAVLGVAGGEAVTLPPCRQRLSVDGRLSYLGGSTPLPAGLSERARNLALRAMAALPPLVGYAGVDLVLGDDPDGAGDVVIEINPRLTTSYVGLRRAVRGGLIGPMLAAAAGEAPEIGCDDRPLAFDADGAVYWA